jgi:hypothetical protein
MFKATLLAATLGIVVMWPQTATAQYYYSPQPYYVQAYGQPYYVSPPIPYGNYQQNPIYTQGWPLAPMQTVTPSFSPMRTVTPSFTPFRTVTPQGVNFNPRVYYGPIMRP